jgi:hypothetical protein
VSRYHRISVRTCKNRSIQSKETEDECSTASEDVVDPVTPSLEVVGPALGGDVSERVTANFFAHRDRDVSDFLGLWMDLPEFEVTTGSVNWLVSHFCERVYEFTGRIWGRHSYSENHGASCFCGSSGTASGSNPRSRRSASVTGSPISPLCRATASSRLASASDRVSP